MKLLDSLFRISLFNNVGLKVTAMIFAILTWMAITQVTSFEQEVRDVPVLIKHDEGVSLLDHNPRNFTVVLRGTRTAMLTLDDRDVQVEIDLRGMPFNEEQVYIIKPKNIIFPGSGKVVSIEPASVTIKLDQPDAKRVAVQAQTVNEPPEGYLLESVVCVPESILIKGSRKRLEVIDQVFTQLVDLNGKIQSFEQRVEIQPPNVNWEGSMEPSSVIMQINISENFVEKTFTNITVGLLRDKEVTSLVTVEPATVEVVLRGNPKLLAELNADSLSAYINLNGQSALGFKAMQMAVNLDFNDRVSLVSVSPETVSVSAKKRDDHE